MCEFCNFEDNWGNDIPANKAIVDDEVIYLLGCLETASNNFACGTTTA